MEPQLGWNPDLEEQHEGAIVEMSAPAPVCSSGEIPKELDVSWFTQQDQGLWPFCHAHMRTAALEYLYWVATRGQVVQYSRRFATITNLREDGDDSRPNGASIGGSMRASKRYGEALEELFPYFGDNSYSNKIPDSVMQNASENRVRSLVPACRSFDVMDAAMTSGLVALALGFEWTTGWDDLKGLEYLDDMPRGQVRGGHALAGFGWRTRAGERWYAIHNSHPQWGVGRKIYIAPRIWDRLLKESRFGACLVSDLQLKDAPPARPWDWLETANFSNGMKLDLG